MKKVAALIAMLLAFFIPVLIDVRIEERGERQRKRHKDRDLNNRRYSMDSRELKTTVGIDISTLCENCSITALHDEERVKIDGGRIACSKD